MAPTGYIHVNNMIFSQPYTEMFDLLDDCILVVDMDQRIVLFNRASEILDDLKREEVLGKTLMEAYESGKYISATMKSMRERRAVRNMVQNYTTIHGKNIFTISSSYPLIAQGEMVGVMTITKDMSKFRETMRVFKEHAPKEVTEVAQGPNFTFEDLIGQSPSFQAAIDQARQGAASKANILIYGETGTGKELFASAIHQASGVHGQFVPINCAAIPENLLEALLFGTAEGAYTGAKNTAGLFEEARHGTLFLDELNSMSMDLQAKLLRAVETKRIRRIGESKEEKIDLRFLCAVNKNPQEAIADGQLRRDLYYRLGVVNVTIPPLRERPGDIEVLVQYFLEKNNRTYGKKIPGLREEVWEVFHSYSWPGNVRELEHVVEHAYIMGELGRPLGLDQLPQFLFDQGARSQRLEVQDPSARLDLALDDQLAQLERTLIQEALDQARGNVAQAGRQLGLSRQTLAYRMKKHGLA